MRFESFIALRYLRGKRKTRFINLITLISTAGVSVGVIALIVVMSVMTGFDIELRATIIGNRSHLAIMDPFGRPVQDPQHMLDEVTRLCPEIVAASPYIEVLGLLKTVGNSEPRYEGAYIMGVDIEKETAVTQIADNLTTRNGRTFGFGDLPGKKEIMLGYVLADRLRVTVGDELVVITPRTKATPFGLRPGQELLLRVSGIAQAQMSEFDSMYAFVDIETAQMLTGKQGVDGVHCKLTSPDIAGQVAQKIEAELGYATVTWYESQQAFFEALVQEKVVMYVILVFIILVAAFNITSTLIMIVMEKRRDIGILRTIGTSTGSIIRIFILQGLYIGLAGTFSGLLLGIFLAHNLNPVANVIAWMLGVDLFNQQIYYFDRIPVAIVWQDVASITISAVILTFLSTIYPAWSAARVDPVDALRNE